MMCVTVAFATPQKQVEISLVVEENCTVALAIDRSRICERFPEIKLPEAKVGIHGQFVKLDASLQAGDRVEIYRLLTIDPKDARRLRTARKV